ncbi:MAG TPA: hypothetical protein VK029_11935 [Pseudogracilibacillus sp.]|nr:hypothetical protein [Pseudogracilibacillus sp.]
MTVFRATNFFTGGELFDRSFQLLYVRFIGNEKRPTVFLKKR